MRENRSKNLSKKPIIILGCERSGSTWLFNILDSDPSTISYIEPFADYAGLFPGFPQRFDYLNKVQSNQAHWICEKFLELFDIKFGFLYQPGYPIYLRKIDDLYVNILERFTKISGAGRSKKIEQYQLLNLSQLDFKKNPIAGSSRLVIKELRLNFKISLVKSLFPDAAVIVAIRNPVLQIDSILKRFRNNNLTELTRSLLFFESSLSQHSRFSKYQSLISDYSQKDISDQLAIYWLVSYNTLIEDLDVHGLHYTIANNDRISLSPEEEIKRLLDHCEIPISPQIQHYLNISTKSNSNSASPIGTNRESQKYYLDLMNNMDRQFENRVMDLIKGRLHIKIEKSLDIKNTL